ncbi:hypothetical protein WMY93_033752 [Mugilogobius chulae]|uniref:Uncharacterized protein n=1 Tax=Mugilogobius chulae TaxID=88201 RepID=A0AAW0MJT5_9GOBI
MFQNFSSSEDGLAFNALITLTGPDLFDSPPSFARTLAPPFLHAFAYQSRSFWDHYFSRLRQEQTVWQKRVAQYDRGSFMTRCSIDQAEAKAKHGPKRGSPHMVSKTGV